MRVKCFKACARSEKFLQVLYALGVLKTNFEMIMLRVMSKESGARKTVQRERKREGCDINVTAHIASSIVEYSNMRE